MPLARNSCETVVPGPGYKKNLIRLNDSSGSSRIRGIRQQVTRNQFIIRWRRVDRCRFSYSLERRVAIEPAHKMLRLALMSFRSIARGWVGEHAVSALLTASLNKEIYTSIHGVIVPTADGTAQIDHIVVSRFGIFVVETKNIRGWIFGREKDPQWTQVLFGEKRRFQNPLRQNYGHTRALGELLLLDHSIFHSIVFFTARCEFKTPIPRNVMTSGLALYIQEFQRPCLDEIRVAKVVDKIQSLKRSPYLTGKVHFANLKQRIGA